MFGIYEQIATMLDPVLPVNEKRLKRQVKDVFPIHLYLLEFEWIPDWMKPPNMVPASPEAVKMPLRLPSSFSVYQAPRM